MPLGRGATCSALADLHDCVVVGLFSLPPGLCRIELDSDSGFFARDCATALGCLLLQFILSISMLPRSHVNPSLLKGENPFCCRKLTVCKSLRTSTSLYRIPNRSSGLSLVSKSGWLMLARQEQQTTWCYSPSVLRGDPERYQQKGCRERIRCLGKPVSVYVTAKRNPCLQQVVFHLLHVAITVIVTHRVLRGDNGQE